MAVCAWQWWLPSPLALSLAARCYGLAVACPGPVGPRCAGQDGRSQAEGDFGRAPAVGLASGPRVETSRHAAWWPTHAHRRTPIAMATSLSLFGPQNRRARSTGTSRIAGSRHVEAQVRFRHIGKTTSRRHEKHPPLTPLPASAGSLRENMHSTVGAAGLWGAGLFPLGLLRKTTTFLAYDMTR